ncbi:MAG: CDP-alcohol phosphatidyltransferase family protein [bacterium JZ-2024 1]
MGKEKPLKTRAIHKVDASARFVDLSDYLRPAADYFVNLLVDTRISPIQVTLLYGVVGFVAGWLILSGLPETRFIGAGMLMLKNLLDSMDGGLARARKKPSRVGRLLDSLLDFFINAWVLYAMAPFQPILALAALLSITLQGTFYNYYYVLYRHATFGDTTSKLNEGWESPYAYDARWALFILAALYRAVYGWQDTLAMSVDSLLTRGTCPPPTRRFMTFSSIFGLGVHLAWMVAGIVIGKPLWVIYAFIGPFNALLLLLFIVRAHWRCS